MVDEQPNMLKGDSRMETQELFFKEIRAAKQALGSQPHGVIVPVSEHPDLASLEPFVNYQSSEVGCCRKIVDHLDQVTIWRMK